MGANRDEDRTLRHENEYLVKSIYRFFRSVCMSPAFTLSEWGLLSRPDSMQ